MLNKYTESSLDAAIRALEMRQAEEVKLLKSEFNLAFESLRPINLIKNTLDEVQTSSELKGNLMNTAMGLGAGFLTKKVFVSLSGSPVKRLIGEALMFGITNLVVKNPAIIKTVATVVLKLLKREKSSKIVEKEPEIDREYTFWP